VAKGTGQLSGGPFAIARARPEWHIRPFDLSLLYSTCPCSTFGVMPQIGLVGEASPLCSFSSPKLGQSEMLRLPKKRGRIHRFLHSSITREYSGMSYSAFITDFLRRVQLPRLSAWEPLPDKELIQQTTAAKEHEISRGSQASCARGLLLLAAGDVDQAHRIVQEMSTPDASYIHGSLAIARHSIWDPVLVTDMVETSRTSGVTKELRAILTIEFEELLRFLWNTV
jgi:hypothetical protein